MGDLPKLLTRAFAIGYLLPAAALIVAIAGIFHAFDRTQALKNLFPELNLTLGVVAALVACFTAILLLAVNRPLIRILEGYGPINPARLWHWYRRAEFRKLNARMNGKLEEWDTLLSKKRPVDPAIPAAYGKALWQLACFYPDREELVLPTKFGNILRAFEVYPGIVYGVESTVGWTRLNGVIPKDFRELINDEKSQVDFWLNVWFAGWFCALLYCVLAAVHQRLEAPWIPLAALAVSYGATHGANQLAYSWGVMVMSSFDLFREDLAVKLGLDLPRTIEKERLMWQAVSQVWVYRSIKAAKTLDAYRAKDKGGKKK